MDGPARPEALAGHERPVVSLLVAVRNEAAYVRRCLDSILAQDYPADRLEVLVLDGDSTDGSRALAERCLAGRTGARLVRNEGITQARGWNLGISLARGQVIGIVSGHAELAPDYVSQAVDTLQRTGAAMVGGPARPVSAGVTGEAIAVGQSTRFGVGGARFRYSRREEEVDTVFMGVCRKDLYERLGGFDPVMDRNQDDELSYRVRDAGGRIVCNPAIRSSYFGRTTLGSLWRQYYAYGYWKVRVWRLHPRQMRPGHFVPAAFVLGAVALGAAGFLPRVGWLPLAVFGALYLTSSLAASAWAARGRWRVFPLLPPVYAILHVAYGAGFLGGLVRYLTRGEPRPGGLEAPRRGAR